MEEFENNETLFQKDIPEKKRKFIFSEHLCHHWARKSLKKEFEF